MNAFATQLRFGGVNFAARISRCASSASDASPVSLEITFVDVTSPLALTYASTTTRPCRASCSDIVSVGVFTNAKSVLQPLRAVVALLDAVAPSRPMNRDATHPIVPSASFTFDHSSLVARSASRSCRFACVSTAASVLGSRRTFTDVAITSTTPRSAAAAGWATGAGGCAGTTVVSLELHAPRTSSTPPAITLLKSCDPPLGIISRSVIRTVTPRFNGLRAVDNALTAPNIGYMDKTRLFLAAGVVAVFAVRTAAQINPNPPTPPYDYNITVLSTNDVTAKRQALIRFIWGSAATALPTALPDSVVTNIPWPITSGTFSNLLRVDLLKFNESTRHRGRALYFIPRSSNGEIVLVHKGHGDSIDGSTALTDDDGANGGIRRTIDTLLAEGYGVVAIEMPHMWGGICVQNSSGVSSDGRANCTAFDSEPTADRMSHDQMFTDTTTTPAGMSPIRWFVEPEIETINYLQSIGAAIGYHMIGLSGGGWTTTICAAIDPRIQMSFPVAGSIPIYLRPNAIEGDSEQNSKNSDGVYVNGLYDVAGFPDLYIVGSAGFARLQVQILNRYDLCCWGEGVGFHNQGTGPAWNNAIRAYEQRVRSALAGMGHNGEFRLEIDEASAGHYISWNALIGTILAELEATRSYVGASSASHQYVRGGSTQLWHYRAAGWEATPFVVAGVPAAPENAVSVLDVFHRDAFNLPQRAAWSSTTGWTANALPVAAPAPPTQDWSVYGLPGIISDFAVASRAAGTYDAVAVGRDYQLYRWQFGASTSTAITSTATDGYVRGTPSIVVSNNGTNLDVLYRGDIRTLHSVHWDGAQWTHTVVGGSIKGFPSAVTDSDGTVRVYCRGMSNGLWEVWRAPGSNTWHWTGVSDGTTAQLIASSPSAAVQNGIITVYARSAQGSLVAFSRTASGWVYSDKGGMILGSPTAVATGALARGLSGNLWFFNGTTFIGYGGYFD
jgi:hypothetical protein